MGCGASAQQQQQAQSPASQYKGRDSPTERSDNEPHAALPDCEDDLRLHQSYDHERPMTVEEFMAFRTIKARPSSPDGHEAPEPRNPAAAWQSLVDARLRAFETSWTTTSTPPATPAGLEQQQPQQLRTPHFRPVRPPMFYDWCGEWCDDVRSPAAKEVDKSETTIDPTSKEQLRLPLGGGTVLTRDALQAHRLVLASNKFGSSSVDYCCEETSRSSEAFSVSPH